MRNDRNVGMEFFFEEVPSQEVPFLSVNTSLYASESHETCEFPVTRSRKVLVNRHCCRKRNEVRRTNRSVGVDAVVIPGNLQVPSMSSSAFLTAGRRLILL